MLSDGESAELAELRRRAWGEDPDILDDEQAVARLQELEDQARPEVVEAPRVDSPALNTEPVVERASAGEPDEMSSEEAPGDDSSTSSRTAGNERSSGAGRSVLLIVGVVITVVALAAGVRSILVPPPPPAASPSPSITRAAPRTLPAVACGDGWGLTGSLSTPDGKPVWSRQFDFPISETWVMPDRGARMVGIWANLDVQPGTISDVEVVSPSTARLFYTSVRTWTAPPSPEEILANAKPSIVLPECANPDSYPGFILAAAPACVTLEFTIDGTRHYTARTPVGIDEGAHCPTP